MTKYPEKIIDHFQYATYQLFCGPLCRKCVRHLGYSRKSIRTLSDYPANKQADKDKRGGANSILRKLALGAEIGQ